MDVIEVSVIEAEVLEVKEMKLELDFVEVSLVRGEKRAAVMTGSPVGAKVGKLGQKRVPKGYQKAEVLGVIEVKVELEFVEVPPGGENRAAGH